MNKRILGTRCPKGLKGKFSPTNGSYGSCPTCLEDIKEDDRIEWNLKTGVARHAKCAVLRPEQVRAIKELKNVVNSIKIRGAIMTKEKILQRIKETKNPYKRRNIMVVFKEPDGLYVHAVLTRVTKISFDIQMSVKVSFKFEDDEKSKGSNWFFKEVTGLKVINNDKFDIFDIPDGTKYYG